MKSELLACSETMKIEYFYDEEGNHRNLAYIFSPSMNRNLNGNDFGGNVFFRNGYDTIAFKVSNDDWFQSIPLYLFEVISEIITKRGYIKKIAYGSSMGGYASIALSKLLDCNMAIVFSPQFSIDEEFDKRWSAYAKKINFKYRISKDSIRNDCIYLIFYDNKDADEIHVKKLLEILPIDNTQLIKLPYTGHPSAHYLAEVGMIKELLIKIINDGNVHELNFLENKRISKSYFQHLSHNLFKRNHVRWALSAIDSAIKIDANVSGFHRHKSILLDRLGRSKEAMASINEAIRIEPNNSHNHHHLSSLLNKQGIVDKAIEASKKSISLNPHNPHLFGHLSTLLTQLNLLDEALSAIDSAIKIDANVSGFHRHKSILLDRLGRSKEAMASINEAIRIEPNNSHNHHHLSSLLNKQGIR